MRTLTRTRRLAVAAALLALALGATGFAAAGPVPYTSVNMEWKTALPLVTGASLEFFEREVDGEVRRYAAVGEMGYGVHFVDITDPLSPQLAGQYVTPGVNYHTGPLVNAARDIMVLNVDYPGANVAMGIGSGIEFVDISDLSSPTRLSVVQGLDGPHKLSLVGDRYVYTTLPTYVVDYADPTAPENLGRVDQVCAHGAAPHPSDPGIAFHASCSQFKWQVVDVSDPENPVEVAGVFDTELEVPHDALPTPDVSLVAVSDLRADYFEVECPGGGIHLYDTSGVVDPTASLSAPKKLGTWFAPYTGLQNDPSASQPYASCTVHGIQMNPERALVASANYAGGSWIIDPTVAPSDAHVDEYRDRPGLGRGPTTWGSTLGGWVDAGDFAWYLKWAPFDDPAYERLLFGISPTQGFEVLEYTGPLPDKIAQLTASRDGVTVTGRLGRQPLASPDGPVSQPLAGQPVVVTAGGTTATATTAPDGTFAVSGLPEGPATVSWAGMDGFAPRTTTTG